MRTRRRNSTRSPASRKTHSRTGNRTAYRPSLAVPFAWILCAWGGLAALSGCSTTPTASDATSASVPVADLREAYTRYFEVITDEGTVGYLLAYDPVPLHAKVERRFPAGSYRIQDSQFNDAGFITPSGEVFRHTSPGRSESLGTWNLNVALQRFYGTEARIQLSRL